MSEQNLGSGIFLDEQLDLSVGTTGDLLTVDGIDELEKDLAVQMIQSMQQYLGKTPTNTTEAEAKRTAYRTAIADVRISSVDRENIVVEWQNRTQNLRVDVPVTTNTDEEYNLVFNV